MHDDLKAKLERFLPIGVVVRMKDNKVHGITELSFAMDTDPKRVRAFWSGKAYSILGEHQLDGLKDAKHNAKKDGDFMFDALSDECPIDIDWERWIADMDKQPGDKYAKRNAPFTVKPHGEWQLRAMQAEKDVAALKPRLENALNALTEEREVNNKIRAVLNPPEEETEDEDHV